MSFKVGDRVKTKSYYGSLANKEGTICDTGNGQYGVCFDENFGGHNCSGTCKDGHGRWVHEDYIELVSSKQEKGGNMLFKIGDRVMINANYPQGDLIGMEGIVCDIRTGHYGVCFDENFGGHNCSGTCKDGHGYYVDGIYLELISSGVVEDHPSFYYYLATYSISSLKNIQKSFTGQTSSYFSEIIISIIDFIKSDENWEEKTSDTFKKYHFKEEYRQNFIREAKDFLKSNNKSSKKEVTTMKNSIFNQFMPSFANSEDFALTMGGKLAIKRSDDDYVTFNPETSQIENQMDLVIGGKEFSKMIILMPTLSKDLKVGDIISYKGVYRYVTSVGNKLDTINLSNGTTSNIVKETNVIVGDQMYKKVVSLFDTFGACSGTTGGINPMMFMLMSDKDKGEDSDMMKMLMLSSFMGGGMAKINPMMLFMLGDKGGDNDMMKLMMFSSMTGGANPFVNMFGINSTPTASATE